MKTDQWGIKKDLVGSGRGLIEVLSQKLPDGTHANHKKKNSARIADVPGEIRTEHLPNMSPHRYRQTSVSQTLVRGPQDGP
jgi:hypothetical protein